MRQALLFVLCMCAHAGEVMLRGPLTTVVPTACPPGATAIEVRIRIPADAPRDLGFGIFVADHVGTWWQKPLASDLTPGEHVRRIELRDAMAAEPPPASWAAMRQPTRAGVYLWSATRRPVPIGVEIGFPVSSPVERRQLLTDLRPGPARLVVGERYEMQVRAEPLPADPYDEAAFVLRLRIHEPDGGERVVGGFLRETMTPTDRGDREDMRPRAPLCHAVRFRPRQPGRHRLQVEAVWADGTRASAWLPDLHATGAPVTGIVRVDPQDPRYFSVDGELWWPVGLNLHSPFDLRSRDVIKTRLTPARGTHTYAAILERLAAAGGNACEIWLSSWNLGLQWRADWPGFAGLNGINLANAERFDLILDHAWQLGIRIKPVINNHGQASPRTDREWKDNPLNTANGGPCATPAEVFTHPLALAAQERVRRYIVARWADHPAIWGWKLWSEIDLTAGVGEPMRLWHEQAAARWHALDPSGRGVTTHWAGDYRRVDHAIAGLPGIDYICLDAYRRARADQDPTPLVDILAGSLNDSNRGLAHFAKPVVVTEYGAGSGESPEDFRAVDHLTGAWIALVSGHAAAPMLWWWEWVDQGERWGPYGAIQRFIVGEDLRGAEARSIALVAEAPEARLWCRTWIRPGHALGYVLEANWGARGGRPPVVSGAVIRVAEQVEAGTLRVQWWDADSGQLVSQTDHEHPGGAFALNPQPFAGHLAWKIRRLQSDD